MIGPAIRRHVRPHLREHAARVTVSTEWRAVQCAARGIILPSSNAVGEGHKEYSALPYTAGEPM